MFRVKISDFVAPHRERIREAALSPNFESLAAIVNPTMGGGDTNNDSIEVYSFLADSANALRHGYNTEDKSPSTIIVSGTALMNTRKEMNSESSNNNISSGRIEEMCWMSSTVLALLYSDGICFLLLPRQQYEAQVGTFEQTTARKSSIPNAVFLGDAWLLYANVILVRRMLIDATYGVPTMSADAPSMTEDEEWTAAELGEYHRVLHIRSDPVRDAIWIQLDSILCCFHLEMTFDGNFSYSVIHRVPLNNQPLLLAGAVPQWTSSEGFLFVLDDEDHEVKFWMLHPAHTAICVASTSVPPTARTIFSSDEGNFLVIVGPHGIQVVDAEEVVHTTFTIKSVKRRKGDLFRSVIGTQLDIEHAVHLSWRSVDRVTRKNVAALTTTHPLPESLKRPLRSPRVQSPSVAEVIGGAPAVPYDFEDDLDDVRILNGTIACIANGRRRIVQLSALDEVLLDETIVADDTMMNISLCLPPVPAHVIAIVALKTGVQALIASNRMGRPLHRDTLIRNEINFECLQNAIQLCLLNDWDLREIQERSLRIALDTSPKAVYDVLLDVYQRESGQPTASSPFSTPSNRTPMKAAEPPKPRRLPIMLNLVRQVCNAVVARYDNCPDDPSARHELKSLISTTMIFLSKLMENYTPLLGTDAAAAMCKEDAFRDNVPLRPPFAFADASSMSEEAAVRYDTYVVLCFASGLRELQSTIKTLAITPNSSRAATIEWSPHHETRGRVVPSESKADEELGSGFQLMNDPALFCDEIVRLVVEKSPSAALCFINSSMVNVSDRVRALLGSFLQGSILPAADVHSDSSEVAMEDEGVLSVHLDAGSVLSLQHVRCIVLRLLYDNLVGLRGQPNVQRAFNGIRQLFGRKEGRVLWRRLALTTVKPSLRTLAVEAFPKMFDAESNAVRLLNLFYQMDRLSDQLCNSKCDESFSQVFIRRIHHGVKVSVALSGTPGPYSMTSLFGSFTEIEETGFNIDDWTKHTKIDVAEIDDTDGVRITSSQSIAEAAEQRFSTGCPPYYFPICMKWIASSPAGGGGEVQPRLFSALFEEMLFCRRDRGMQSEMDFLVTALLKGDPYVVIPVGSNDKSVMLDLCEAWRVPFTQAAITYCEDHLDADAAQWLGSSIGIAARRGSDASDLLNVVAAELSKAGCMMNSIIDTRINQALATMGGTTQSTSYPSSLMSAWNFASVENIPAAVFPRAHVAEWVSHVLSLPATSIPEDLIIQVLDNLSLWKEANVASQLQSASDTCRLVHAYRAGQQLENLKTNELSQFITFLLYSLRAGMLPEHADLDIYESVLHSVNGCGRMRFHPLVLFELAEYNNESVPVDSFTLEESVQKFLERYQKEYADIFEGSSFCDRATVVELASAEAIADKILDTVVQNSCRESGASDLHSVLCDEMLLSPAVDEWVSPTKAQVDELVCTALPAEYIARWQCHEPLTKKSERDETVQVSWRTCLTNSLPMSSFARFSKSIDERSPRLHAAIAECRAQAITQFRDVRYCASVVTFLEFIHEEECQRLRVDLGVAQHLSQFVPQQRLLGVLQKLAALPPSPNVHMEAINETSKTDASEILKLLCDGMESGASLGDEEMDQQACTGVFLIHSFETHYEHLLLAKSTSISDRVSVQHITKLFLSGDWLAALFDAWTLCLPLPFVQKLANDGKCASFINFAIETVAAAVPITRWSISTAAPSALSCSMTACQYKADSEKAGIVLPANSLNSPAHLAAACIATDLSLHESLCLWMHCICAVPATAAEASSIEAMTLQCCTEGHCPTCYWLHIGLCMFARGTAPESLYCCLMNTVVGVLQRNWRSVSASVADLDTQLNDSPQCVRLCRDAFALTLKCVWSGRSSIGTLIGIVEAFEGHQTASQLLNPIAVQWIKSLHAQLRMCESSVVIDVILVALCFPGLRDLLFKSGEKIVSTSERLRDRIASSEEFLQPNIAPARREEMKLAFGAVASKVIQGISGSPIRVAKQLPRVSSSLAKIPSEIKVAFEKLVGPCTPFSSPSERQYVIEEFVSSVVADFAVSVQAARLAAVCLVAECVGENLLTPELCHQVLRYRKEAWAEGMADSLNSRGGGADSGGNSASDMFDDLWAYCRTVLACLFPPIAQLLPLGMKILVEVIAYDGRPKTALPGDSSALMTEPMIDRLTAECATDPFFRQWLQRVFGIKFESGGGSESDSSDAANDDDHHDLDSPSSSPLRSHVKLPSELSEKLDRFIPSTLLAFVQQSSSEQACRDARTQIFYCAVASNHHGAIDIVTEFVRYGASDLFFTSRALQTVTISFHADFEFDVVDCVCDALLHGHFAPLLIDCAERAHSRDTNAMQEFEKLLLTKLLGQGRIGNARAGLPRPLIGPDGQSENAGWTAKSKVLRICSLLEELNDGDRQACIQLGWKLLALGGFQQTVTEMETALGFRAFLAPLSLAICHVNWILSVCYDRALADAVSKTLFSVMESAVEDNDYDLVRQLVFSIDDVTQLKYFLDSLPSSLHFSALTNSSTAFGDQPLHKSSLRIALLSFLELLSADGDCGCPVEMTTIYANFRHFTALGEQLKIEAERMLKAFVEQQSTAKFSFLDSSKEALKRQNRALDEVENRLLSAANFFVQDMMFERAYFCIQNLNLVAVQKKFLMKDVMVIGLSSDQVTTLLHQTLENAGDIITVAHSYNVSSVSDWAAILYRQVARGRRELAVMYKAQCVCIANDVLQKIHEIQMNETGRSSAAAAANLEFLEEQLSRPK